MPLSAWPPCSPIPEGEGARLSTPFLGRWQHHPPVRAECLAMTASELIRRGAVVPEMTSRTKAPALKELLTALTDAGRVPWEGLQEMAAAVMTRERLGTTGIGHGIAVPNARHDLAPRTLVALGRSDHGIEFGALDGAPVHIVLMVLSNRRTPLDHVRTLALIARLFRDERLIRTTRAAKTPDEILHGIEAAERHLR